MRERGPLLGEALRRLVVRTGRWPGWAWLHLTVAHVVGWAAGGRKGSVYVRGSLASGELRPGFSDVDIAVVTAVGVLLAAIAAQVVAAGDWQTLLGATACLGVLLFELIFTVARRAGDGALDVGDRLHSYDLWSARTGSRGRATLHFWLAGAALAALGLAIAEAPGAIAAVLAVLLAAAALAFGRRLWITRPGAW